jgi:peptidoglycan/xylan/chitin deacetylase (PgdA/CDA1 family)
MTTDELRELARHPRAHLGNHTRDHAILTNYDAPQAEQQIARAQGDLAEVVGAAPAAIAYPNGNYSAAVIQAAQRAGLQIGITVEEVKNRVPIDASDESVMRLGRFTPWGNLNIAAQALTFRSDFSLSGSARRVLAHRS